MTILVVGDANADLSAVLARFPLEGDDSPIEALTWGSGGSAANVATALALLGASVRLLARVGRDPAAAVALRMARAAGVDLTTVQYDDRLATGLCFAAISPGGERTFFSFRGANIALDPADQRATASVASWLHIAGHAMITGPQRACALALIEEARQRQIPISLDLCLPLVRERRAEMLELLPHLRILFANESELRALLPDLPPATALTALSGHTWNLSPDAVLALKLGARGSIVVWSGQHLVTPAFSVNAVDTNGCGDAFVAGFLSAYVRGESIDVCATQANAMGALTAVCTGAGEALPSQAQLDAFLKEVTQ